MIKHLLTSNILMVLIPFIALEMKLFSNQIQVYYLEQMSEQCSLKQQNKQNQRNFQQVQPIPTMARYLLSHCQFDGLQFFANQYKYQPNFAFLKGYTTFVQVIRYFLGKLVEIIDLEPFLAFKNRVLLQIFVLITINKIFFSLSALKVQKIAFELTLNKNKSQFIAKLFLYNPACIFFHAVYSESIYSFITFSAIYYALQSKGKMNTSYFKSLVFLVLSVFFRSNGIFLSPMLGIPIMHQLWLKIKQKSLKRTIVQLIKGGVILFVVICPFLAYQHLTYSKICLSKYDLANDNQLRLECQKSLPNIYSYVQNKFWSVGFLTYFKGSNIIFILLGTPSLVLGFSIWKKIAQLFKQMKIRTDQKALIQVGLYLSFAILYTVTMTLTNIQSSTRFFCSHPVFYFLLGEHFQVKAVKFWLFTYYFYGGILFCVGFPWT